jgi:integrase
MEYRVFRPQFRARDGTTKRSKTHHVEFKDHGGIRRRVTAFPHARDSERLAGRILELVRHRRNSEPLPETLKRWADTLPDALRARLAEFDLLDVGTAGADAPLLTHLDGTADAPGWRQALEAKGTTAGHVGTTVQRVRDLITGVGFVTWKDLSRPGAADDAAIWLGRRRERGELVGTTVNYYCRDLRAFSRWLAKRLGRDVPMQDLAGVDNADSDAGVRRELSPEEMRLLIAAAAQGETHSGLTGDERAVVYRFAYETGLRPGQLRALTVADFNLAADPPTVRTAARYVKRRREHTQVLRPGLAADLRERFASKLPAAAAFKLPSKWHMAEMLRRDLAAAREAWRAEKGLTAKQRDERARSDFLLATNHRGESAVFYSTRHAHGSALAAAGIAEKDIAASLHHSSRAVTKRYLHSRQPDLARAVAALPDVSYAPLAAGATRRKRKAGGTQ